VVSDSPAPAIIVLIIESPATLLPIAPMFNVPDSIRGLDLVSLPIASVSICPVSIHFSATPMIAQLPAMMVYNIK
jgi:hypothetical protein